MATWKRQISDDHIRFVNEAYEQNSDPPDWVPIEAASVNLTAVYVVEVHADTRGPFTYVYYSERSAETNKPDLTLQLAPAERLIRALGRRA